MKTALCPKEEERISAHHLHSAKQRENESVRAFGHRLTNLIRSAYPTISQESSEAIALNIFMNGVRPRLKIVFVTNQVGDFEDAINLAAYFEALSQDSEESSLTSLKRLGF